MERQRTEGPQMSGYTISSPMSLWLRCAKPEDQWSCKRSPDIYPGISFNAFIHVYRPRAGADNPLGRNADVNRKPLSLCPFVASFKTICTCFFHVFHMYIAPGRGRQTGVKILISTERPYYFDHLLQVLKKSLWTLILYTFFNVFLRVYSPRADIALGSKFWSQQKGFITLTICCKFKRNLFQLWFNT